MAPGGVYTRRLRGGVYTPSGAIYCTLCNLLFVQARSALESPSRRHGVDGVRGGRHHDVDCVLQAYRAAGGAAAGSSTNVFLNI